MTSIVTGQHRLDLLASIVLLISSCEQVCNVSQFASVPEGKLRIHDGDNDDDDDHDDDDDEDFDGSVLIYFMMIKKRELADVIIVNICLFLSLKEIYHMFTYTKK